MTDPYIDAHGVLRNSLGIVDQAELADVETPVGAYREHQLYVTRPVAGSFDLAHLQAIQRHLFSDVYSWAGELRTIELAKGGTLFAPAGQLSAWGREVFGRLAAADRLRGLDRRQFIAGAAELLADVNAMHPFREGNGRSQRALVNLVANDAGWSLEWWLVDPLENRRAARAAPEDAGPLVELLDRITVAYATGAEIPVGQILGQRHPPRPDPAGSDLGFDL